MTERWQEELRKLRGVRPTAGLDARIAEGPRPEPPPPASRRIVAAVTAFALFAAAGAFAFVVLREDSSNGTVVGGGEDPRLVLALVSTDLAPTATLHYGDQTVDVVTEGYEWCEGEDCAGMIADFTFYPPVGEYLVVPPGTPIEVAGDGSVGRLAVTDPDGERVPGASDLVVPSANGRYVFGFTGVFERGEGSFFFGVQALDSPSSAPDVLSIDCLTGRTDTAVVQTQADGLHVVAMNTQGFSEIDIVTPEGTPPTEFFGVGSELREDGPSVHLVDPGRWEIGCFELALDVEAGDRTVALDLVDPDDHWAPSEIACTDALEESFVTAIPSSVPHEEVAAQLVDGLQPEDRIRGAGYNAEKKIGFVYVVDRGGQAIAVLWLTPEETYEGQFWTCPDGGVGLNVPSDEGGPANVPDVLVVRCEGLGPAVDTPTVRLRPDGLHVEASNIADATIVEVNSDGSVVSQTPFTSVTERFVVDVGPGTVLIGCLVQDEEGNVVGGPDEFPLAYLEVTVLPVE